MHRSITAIVALLWPIAAAGSAGAQILYEFGAQPNDGASPIGGITFDPSGSLFGITYNGGAHSITNPYDAGTVYELSPPDAAGRSVETILHDFPSSPSDGFGPSGTLARDGKGNLYGTTVQGGTNSGIVYELSPPAEGGSTWGYTILASFDGTTARSPHGVILDGAGALYGITSSGGPAGDSGGTLFKLVPPEAGQAGWTLQILHDFGVSPTDGAIPVGAPAMDAHGTLYGTTESGGGTCRCGVVWQATPPASGMGAWTETILHIFARDGRGLNPEAGVAIGPLGGLYGTALGTSISGCNKSCGLVFRMEPPSIIGGTAWGYSVLHQFAYGSDGADPGPAGVALDAAANVYGTTEAGGDFIRGCERGCGTVFKLIRPQQGGAYTEQVAALPHSYDGRDPQGGVAIGPDGRLYGTASRGGKHGGGTVLRLSTELAPVAPQAGGD